MNHLYWFKDNVDFPKDYLETLKKLAIELELEGLEKEINDYLEILK